MSVEIRQPPWPREPDADVAAIVARAEQLGIPAWRVLTALDQPLPHGPPAGRQPPAR
ncbi:MAG: hypothetical protein QOE11_1371 [Solirubrobacteraceae bacterium]|jgi:hypothetical protein|nr:hypothetical protein [Solirubrobacteraceae bacterium]